MGDCRERAHGARRNQHPCAVKRAAGNARRQIANRMHHIRQRVNRFFAVCRFRGAGEFRPFGNHQMRFNLRQRLQQLQRLVAIRKAACAADTNNQTLNHLAHS